MIDTVVVEKAADAGDLRLSGVSWPAVLAGAVASCALALVVLSFGVGLGLSVVSPWGGAGVSATTFKIGTGLFMIVVAMLSSSIGGYIAGRLRSGWTGVHTDEVYFRDTAHGFVAWALATVLGAVLLAAPASGIVGRAAGGAAQAVSSSVTSAGAADRYVDTLLRPDNPANANAVNIADTRAEVSRLFIADMRPNSDFSPGDRVYLAKEVAARTGLSQADAEKRVSDAIGQAKANIDATRKATAQLAFWLTAALLVGAFCSSLAATEGGGLRDGTWGRKTFR